MSRPRGPLQRLRASPVARRAARVAVVTTLIVAAVYAVLAVVVVTVVDGRLTATVDARLTNALGRIPSFPERLPENGAVREPGGGPRFGTPLLAWTVRPDGTQVRPPTVPLLPAPYTGVSDPVTATIGGIDVRIAGRTVGTDHVVVAVSRDEVARARREVIVAELLVAPVLLAAVFLGALSIGRRVAAPVERARRRQIEFTADASHELRTPLSVIEAQTQLALSRDRDPEWYRNAFQAVAGESGRMRRLVEDLLWLARLDGQHQPPAPQAVDLGVLAEQAVARFAPVAEARQQLLALERGDADAAVNAPADWLDRLLGVLLDNACKYTPEGGAVTVRVTTDGGSVCLSVRDSGPGIAFADRERVFDRFHRGGDGTGVGGAGLGLAIADAVIRGTQGHRQVGVSAAGGAEIAVTWPRAHHGGTRHAERPAPRVAPGTVPLTQRPTRSD